MADIESLRAKAAALPDKPGIYFFKSAAGEVVYIGKARSLRDRVRADVQPNPDYKVRNILGETADIDYILTGSEKEAAFLENNYVQQYQPKFNLRLKDDKSFPYLKVTAGEKFPGIYFSRRVGEGKSRYFGPFSPAHRARTSIHLVNKYFHIRGCENAVFSGRKRPCLEYDLKLCSAPCVGGIPESDYRQDVESACLFLEGRTRELLAALKKRMESAAAEQKYEEAAHWRDILKTVEDIRERPRAISIALEDQDVAGFARSGARTAVYVFFMRRGKIRDSESAELEDCGHVSDAALLGRFLAEFYEDREKPRRLLLPFPPEKPKEFEARLASPAAIKTGEDFESPQVPPVVSQKNPEPTAKFGEADESSATSPQGASVRGEPGESEVSQAGSGSASRRHVSGPATRVQIIIPQSGKGRRLVELANRNALALLEKSGGALVPLEELRRALGLKELPRRIEGFDISNTGGEESVGSMVAFRDGRPDKDEYRRFRIQTVVGSNDVASLEEVIRRRYERLLEEGRPMPDLIMVDGGKGQLGAAEKALAALGIADLPVVSIAKKEEVLFIPDRMDGIRLERTSPALKAIQAIRDEAHRFAITLHRSRREKRSFASELDGIPGLGPKKKAALLAKFGTIEAIRAASVDDLAAVIGEKSAAAVHAKLGHP